jgi:hypothetical protein
MRLLFLRSGISVTKLVIIFGVFVGVVVAITVPVAVVLTHNGKTSKAFLLQYFYRKLDRPRSIYSNISLLKENLFSLNCFVKKRISLKNLDEYLDIGNLFV